MGKIDNSLMAVLESIRDECGERKNCCGCPYSCTYYVNYDGKTVQISYACVLKDNPDCWQLETMEGLKDGQ